MTITLRSFLFMVSLALGVQVAVAAVPNTLTYQGTLTDGAGQPISGSKTITFSLYTVPTAGTAFWSEPQTLTLVDGRLSVVLGANAAKPLDASKFTGETYIGIKVGTDTEMPRQKFSSVAYAFQAGDGGVPKGGIIMWSGTVANIPAAWALCDGANGTPDLRDRFIVGAGSGYTVGASGGAASNNLSHSHSIAGESPGTSAQGDHSHYYSSRTDVSDSGSPNRTDGGSTQLRNSHTHTFSGTTNGGGTHGHTVNSHSHGGATGSAGSATLENRPPYYALAFIMKL